VRVAIRSTSRAAGTSTCFSHRTGDQISRATQRLPSQGGGDCTIAALAQRLGLVSLYAVLTDRPAHA